MAATQAPPQHNDSVGKERKKADQGETLRNSGTAPHNPNIGRGHDERGRYGRSVPDPKTCPDLKPGDRTHTS